MFVKQKSIFRSFGLFSLFAVILNLAFWGGLIYFVFWCLKHFGIV